MSMEKPCYCPQDGVADGKQIDDANKFEFITWLVLK